MIAQKVLVTAVNPKDLNSTFADSGGMKSSLSSTLTLEVSPTHSLALDTVLKVFGFLYSIFKRVFSFLIVGVYFRPRRNEKPVFHIGSFGQPG